MTANELRTKYLKFFESKGHAVIPSASLLPENDPTTLFTGSGMQPMVPYLLGEKHPQGLRVADSQKCFRAQDIEDVGDNRHTTMFEMLGNWSLGDYFKKEQIAWMFEFLTKEVGLDPRKLYISVFRGDEKLGIPRDNEAVGFWKDEFSKVGMEAVDVDFSERDGMQNGRIFYYNEKNWWSRAGLPQNMPIGEPGGPDSEMFWDFGAGLKIHENSEYKNQPCHVNCDCGRFLEIGNNVFMQYIKTEKGFELLPQGNIDFGGGLERLVAAKEDTPDIFLTDLFDQIIRKVEEISGKKYDENDEAKRSFRVISDHLKAATFLIADGAVPSNTGSGYVLRRLIRRAVRYGKIIGIEKEFAVSIAEIVIRLYGDFYPELEKSKEKIFDELKKEEQKFVRTLEKGTREFERKIVAKKTLDGVETFDLYQSYGFPLELIEEMAMEKGIEVDSTGFAEELKKHQEKSRTASSGMFKGGLQDSGEDTAKLHTATHLLLAALRTVLGNHVLQKGSNITAERLRFDFSHPEKMTAEQLQRVEDIVNAAIDAHFDVIREEMKLEEARKRGVMGVFEDKYLEDVIVYSIIDPKSRIVSHEMCGGPHAKNTGELGKFKIVKEEASSAGVRRIKAILT
jgi:alanyl-tRNA synthetase